MKRAAWPIERSFWAFVEKTETCWLWHGALQRGGYGSAHRPYGRVVRAHRYSWELTNGPIPGGLCVCHKCDVRTCVRPDHLFLGTRKDNMRDAANKGRLTRPSSWERTRRGSAHGMAKLTDDDVRAIRAERAQGIPGHVVATRHHISGGAVSMIVNRKRWAHLV